MDGEKGSPCFLGNPSDAPWGANLCDTNVSVCLEKWAGPNAGRFNSRKKFLDSREGTPRNVKYITSFMCQKTSYC